MRKAAGKRLPHGVTAVLVLDALRRLHAQAGQKPVSRAALLDAVTLPETTVDDRLRVLVARGDVTKQGTPGRYRYVPMQKLAPNPLSPEGRTDAPANKPQPQSTPQKKPIPTHESHGRRTVEAGGLHFYFLEKGVDFE